MVTRIPITEFRKKFADYIEAIGQGAGSVILTRHGEALAVVISWEDYVELENMRSERNDNDTP